MRLILAILIICIKPCHATTINLVSNEFPPYVSFDNSEENSTYNFIGNILDSIGFKLQVTSRPPARLLLDAKSRRFDGALLVRFDPALEREFILSDPIVSERIGLATFDECAYKTESPLFWKDTEIAYTKGQKLPSTFSQNALQKLPVDNDGTGVRMLAAHRIKLLLIGEESLNVLKKQLPQKTAGLIKFCDAGFEKINLHLAIKKHLPESRYLISEFNGQMRKIRAVGYYGGNFSAVHDRK